MNILAFPNKQQNNDRKEAPVGTPAIGIDLGTTNSVVSLVWDRHTQPETLVYEGDSLVPSALYYDPDSGQEWVGLKARAAEENHAAQVIRSSKRGMGKETQFTSHGRTYLPEQVAQHILSYLILHPKIQEIKEKFGGVWAVITVPAHFGETSRQATMTAAANAGITVLRIINEPTAAALAYSRLARDKNNDKEIFVIFDFGGGTFDVSVVQRQYSSFSVLSSDGDVNLGGDDIDETIAKHLTQFVEPIFFAKRVIPTSDFYKRLVACAEQVKKQLQNQMDVKISLDVDVGPFHAYIKEAYMDRAIFEGQISHLLQRTLLLTQQALHAARVSINDVSSILLVGGSTRLVALQRLLRDYFDRPVDARLEPDLAVSWGATLQAAIILGIDPGTILVDVCSHALGIGVLENAQDLFAYASQLAEELKLPNAKNIKDFKTLGEINSRELHRAMERQLSVVPIIHRNTALPATRSEFFNTVDEGQPAVRILLVQGEGHTVGENRILRSLYFPLQQPCPMGTRCEVQLTYDMNGMVQVSMRQLGTDNYCQARFDSHTGELDDYSNAMQDDILSSMVHTLFAPVEPQKKTHGLRLVGEEENPPKIEPLTTQTVSAAAGNAITLYVEEFLDKCSDSDQARSQRIRDMLQQYKKLLSQATGAIDLDLDKQLESLEQVLMDLLPQSDHGPL